MIIVVERLKIDLSLKEGKLFVVLDTLDVCLLVSISHVLLFSLLTQKKLVREGRLLFKYILLFKETQFVNKLYWLHNHSRSDFIIKSQV